MAHHGMHHLGLATHDMEATLDFYENTLGFETKVCDLLEPESGGTIRHAFMDMGQGEMIAFMECNDVPSISADFDAGINRGPAGLLAYLLLHTPIPSLAAAYSLVKRTRAKARTRHNTFASELEDICTKAAGKPLEHVAHKLE